MCVCGEEEGSRMVRELFVMARCVRASGRVCRVRVYVGGGGVCAPCASAQVRVHVWRCAWHAHALAPSALTHTHAHTHAHAHAHAHARSEHAPSIIFMDEVDSIGSARTDNSGGGGDSEVQRTMLELLNQLDGFEATNKIKVSACVVCWGVHVCAVCRVCARARSAPHACALGRGHQPHRRPRRPRGLTTPHGACAKT